MSWIFQLIFLIRGFNLSPLTFNLQPFTYKLVFSWDSLDLSSAASRRFYIPRSVHVRARQWLVFLPRRNIFPWDMV